MEVGHARHNDAPGAKFYFAAMQHVGVDLKMVPFAEARIHPLDVGLHRGYAVFDYFPVRKGMAWFLRDYLARFRRSAASMGLALAYDDAAIAVHLRALAGANRVDHGGCKLLLTGGPSEDGYTPKRSRLYTYAFAKTPPPAAGGPCPAVRINLLEYARERPGVKTTNYAASLRLRSRQVETGAAEVVYHHGGYVSEASRSNVGVVTAEGALWVPPTDVALPGVTRLHVLAAAREVGIEVREAPLPLAVLRSAPEVLLMGSSRGVEAVGQVEDARIGEGGAGPSASGLGRLSAIAACVYRARKRRCAFGSGPKRLSYGSPSPKSMTKK